MKKELKRSGKKPYKKKSDAKRSGVMFVSSHILIAVVALIECLVMLSFTTYSWIESSSSLIIMNGTRTTSATATIPISKALNYKWEYDSSSSDVPDIGTYFSSIKYYRLSRTTSPDGQNFYFPKNSGYRPGDTTDYNINYTYFDFVLGQTSSIYTFSFDLDRSPNVFTASTTNSEISGELSKIVQAMRVSFQTGDNTPVIYSVIPGDTQSKSYETIDQNVAFTNKIDSTNKLFKSSRNGDTKISVRVWFEMNDPDLDYASWSDTKKAALADVTITTDMTLKCSLNDKNAFEFHDFTLTDNGHISSQSGKSMYFYDGNKRVSHQMQKYTASGDYELWSTGEGAAGVSNDDLSDLDTTWNTSYYYFGSSATPQSSDKKWYLRSAPVEYGGTYAYAAYGEGTNNSGYTYGYGDWVENVQPQKVYVSDYTTAMVTDEYNASSANFKFMQNSATPNQALYVTNREIAGSSPYGFSNSNDKLMTGYRMHYNSNLELFETYVPSSWLSTNNTKALSFRFCPTGKYTVAACLVAWDVTDLADTNGDFIFTALGYVDPWRLTYFSSGSGNNQNAIANGVGTWGSVERVDFSTELIDSDLSGDYRYMIGLKKGDVRTASSELNDPNTYVYYTLIPDEYHMSYYAYVPEDIGDDNSTTTIRYRRYTSYRDASHTPSSIEWTNSGVYRSGSSTFYPVSTSSPAGYWNIAVLVDGTYEDLIWDDDNNRILGTLTATVGGLGKTVNKIDNYRYYVTDGVSFGSSSVSFVWTPYTGTSFTYTFTPDEGSIYRVVTE